MSSWPLVKKNNLLNYITTWNLNSRALITAFPSDLRFSVLFNINIILHYLMYVECAVSLQILCNSCSCTWKFRKLKFAGFQCHQSASPLNRDWVELQRSVTSLVMELVMHSAQKCVLGANPRLHWYLFNGHLPCQKHQLLKIFPFEYDINRLTC